MTISYKTRSVITKLGTIVFHHTVMAAGVKKAATKP